jgi:hypothetical protein
MVDHFLRIHSHIYISFNLLGTAFSISLDIKNQQIPYAGFIKSWILHLERSLVVKYVKVPRDKIAKKIFSSISYDQRA